jgi:uncharacterized integral membrane protein
MPNQKIGQCYISEKIITNKKACYIWFILRRCYLLKLLVVFLVNDKPKILHHLLNKAVSIQIRPRWENHIKMYLQEVGCGGME